jgi:hypothetical protein
VLFEISEYCNPWSIFKPSRDFVHNIENWSFTEFFNFLKTINLCHIINHLLTNYVYNGESLLKFFKKCSGPYKQTIIADNIKLCNNKKSKFSKNNVLRDMFYNDTPTKEINNNLKNTKQYNVNKFNKRMLSLIELGLTEYEASLFDNALSLIQPLDFID